MSQGWKYLETKNGYKVKIDTEDFERVNNHSWRAITSGARAFNLGFKASPSLPKRLQWTPPARAKNKRQGFPKLLHSRSGVQRLANRL